MLSKDNYEFLAKFRSKPTYTSVKSDTRFQYFRELQYIEPDSYVRDGELENISITPATFRLTPRGEDALSEFETMAKQKSDEKSEKKKDRAFDILLALLGAIIGLLIERFSGIVDWFISLF